MLRRILVLAAVLLGVAAPPVCAAIPRDSGNPLALDQQPYLAAIHEPSTFPALRPVLVAVVDSGVDGANPDLPGGSSERARATRSTHTRRTGRRSPA